MSSSILQRSILGPKDVEDLTNRGLLRPADRVGMSRLHKRRAHRSSDEENEDIPLDVQTSSDTAVDPFVNIPDVLISKETLLYVGYDETKAEELWNRWSDWPADGPQRETDEDDGGLQVTFEDFITLRIGAGGSPDTDSEDDSEWTACLTAYGLATDVQAAILDPLFKEIRLNQTAAFWARDTIAMRYAGLGDIQQASREREMTLERAASRAASGQGQGQGLLVSASSSAEGHSRRSISGIQAEATAGISTDTISSVAARNAPGSVVLYKGIDKARISNLWDDNGNVVYLEALVSAAPGDFNGSNSMFYFTPDYKVAEYYAAYAKRRVECESVVIVAITIADAAIEALESPEIQRLYWPSSEWKELVWLSRRKKAASRRLSKYAQAMLIIGNIAKCANLAYHRLETWEAVGEKHLLKVNGPEGSVAVQYAFSNSLDGVDWLMEHGARTLKAYPMTSGELETWSAHQADLIAN